MAGRPRDRAIDGSPARADLGPGAYLLPIAIGGSLWMFAAKKGNTFGFAGAVLVSAAALFALFEWLPPQAEQTHFGVTRPALLLAPLLWLGIAIHCWRGRASDRMLRALAWTAPVLVVANLVRLYSPREGDAQSIVGHLGTLVGYFVLLLLLLKLASSRWPSACAREASWRS